MATELALLLGLAAVVVFSVFLPVGWLAIAAFKTTSEDIQADADGRAREVSADE